MSALPYIYRWDRQGRKGQPCEVLIRAKVSRMNEIPADIIARAILAERQRCARLFSEDLW